MITVYRYGAVAWLWRALIAIALLGGAGCLVLAVRSAAPALAIVGAILIVPALFFGLVVATHIVRAGDDRMVVHSLLFVRRAIARERVRPALVRREAQGTAAAIYAPRAWIPIRGGLPVYVDLLAHIPDPGAFAAWWRVPRRELPGRRPHGE